LFVFLLSLCSHLFAENDLITGMDSLSIGEYMIFSGRISDRDAMIESGFSGSGFMPYNKEKLVNDPGGGNYHVFKTIFEVSGNFIGKNLTLYISRFDMPVIISVNNTVIYQKGFRKETDKVYSTGEQAAFHVPIAPPLIYYDAQNLLVIEVFPQYETSSMPQLSIGEYKDNAVKVFIKNLLNIYLVLAAQFLGLLVAFYHFGSFISRGAKDLKYIFFSLLSLSFALAYLNIGFSFDTKYYTLIIKITRCCQLLSVGFYLLFIIESVKLFSKQKKYIITAFIFYSIICVGYVALSNDKLAVNEAFSFMTNIYMIPALALCIIISVLSIILKKNYMILLLLFTTLSVAGASLRDMLLLSAAAQPLFWFAPYAFLLLVIVIFGILVYEESSLFKNFMRYVPADLVIQLINKNILADLGGEQQELTVFFSDIAKFTSITEKMEPEKVVQDLCVYFENISRVILANNGTIDKYIGDSVMAFWGAPVHIKDHAKKACHAALAVQENLHSLFSEWESRGKYPFNTRIGIHTGNVLVGNLGYKERLNYTVMGDTVNVSSRLEGINKAYGTEIVVSESVHKSCPDDFEFRHLDRVLVLGRNEAMNIYELIAYKGEIRKNQKKINEYYETGLQYYFIQDWLEALKYFNTVVKYRPKDAPARIMRERCLLYRKNPPPPEWDGVFLQTVK